MYVCVYAIQRKRSGYQEGVMVFLKSNYSNEYDDDTGAPLVINVRKLPLVNIRIITDI